MAASQTVWGWHSIGHLLEQRPTDVLSITIQEGREDARAQALAEQAAVTGVHIQHLPRSALDKLSGGASHQGIVAQIRQRPELGDGQLEDDLAASGAQRLLLVLDGIQDPHNLGACLRVADGAGVTGVIAPKRRAVGLNDTVRKVASGAAETVPFYRVTNLARTLRMLGDLDVQRIGTSDQADKTLYDQPLTDNLAIVMGGEAKGLRRLTAEHCDALVALPMLGVLSSLNVSVAAGICLYEARRQRIANAGANQ